MYFAKKFSKAERLTAIRPSMCYMKRILACDNKSIIFIVRLEHIVIAADINRTLQPMKSVLLLETKNVILTFVMVEWIKKSPSVVNCLHVVIVYMHFCPLFDT
jgi:hypothetical protein